MSIVITGQNGDYEVEVEKRVFATAFYRLRFCKQIGTNRVCLMQVAIERAHNGVLDRAAFCLKELARQAAEFEAAYALTVPTPKGLLNYQLGFPALVESFLLPGEDGRRVNVLAFDMVDKIGDLVPLHHLIKVDEVAIDAQSSVWLVGKALKLMTLAHSLGISIGNIDINRFWIVPDRHYVVLFDWTGAKTFPEGVPREIARADIQDVATSVIEVMGGNRLSREFPEKGIDRWAQYTDHLLRLAVGGQSNAEQAHREFYELVDSVWARGFHPFATFPNTTSIHTDRG